MRRVLTTLAVGTIGVFGAAFPVEQTPELPTNAQALGAAVVTGFDTPTGSIQNGYYYALEDGSGYIAYDSKRFSAQSGYEEFSKTPFKEYKEAKIISHTPILYYQENGTKKQTIIDRSRYDKLGEKDATFDVLKQSYTKPLIETLVAPKAQAAIAFDASATGGPTTSTSITYALTTTGTNIDVVSVSYTLTDVTTGITFNSVSATMVKSGTFPGAGRLGAKMYLNTNTGAVTANVVISTSASVQIIGYSGSYSGAQVSTTPDATGTNSGTGATSTCTLTVVAANSWLIASDTNAGGADTSGTGTVRRTSESSSGSLYDSNAGLAAGSQSSTVTHASASAAWETICISLAPVGGGVVPGVNASSSFF